MRTDSHNASAAPTSRLSLSLFLVSVFIAMCLVLISSNSSSLSRSCLLSFCFCDRASANYNTGESKKLITNSTGSSRNKRLYVAGARQLFPARALGGQKTWIRRHIDHNKL